MCRLLFRLLLGGRCHFLRLTSRLVLTWLPDGFFESWKNGFEKGILNESEDRLGSAGLGILKFTGDSGHRCNFIAGWIF